MSLADTVFGQVISTQDALALLKAAARPHNEITVGRGHAYTTVESNDISENHEISFEFSGDKLRSKVTDTHATGSASTTILWIAAVDRSFTFNGFNLGVEKRDGIAFYRMIGRDFSPEGLQTLQGYSIAESLQGIARNIEQNHVRCEAITTEDGTIRCTSHYIFADTRMSAVEVIEIDPQLDLRIVKWYEEQHNVNGPGSMDSVDCKWVWKRYGDKTYPSRVSLRQRFAPGARSAKDGFTPSENRTEVIIDQFDPDARIDDADFTVASLGVPIGALVDDGIARIDYYYGGAPAAASDLEKALETSEGWRAKGEGTVGRPQSALPFGSAAPSITNGMLALLAVAALVMAGVGAFWAYRKRVFRRVAESPR